MFFKSACSLFMLASVLSCVTKKSSPTRPLSEQAAEIPSPPICPAGEANYLMLKKLAVPIDSDALAKSLLPKLAPNFRVVDLDATKNIRVTVCISFPQGLPHFELKEILFVMDNYVASHQPYRKAALVEHLDEALAGNVANLLLRVSDGDSAIEIRGHTEGDKSFVTAVEGIEQDEKFYYSASNTYAGTLDFGNPFIPEVKDGIDLRCRETVGPNSQQVENIFVVGTAKLYVTGCSTQGSGNSIIYDYRTVDVLDTSPTIPAQYQGMRTKFSANDTVIKHSESHHNWCDNIHISIPKMKAEYAIVSRAQADFKPILLAGKELKGTAVSYQGIWKLLSDSVPGFCK